MSSSKVPQVIGDINAAWLTSALRDGGRNDGIEGVEVDHVDVEPFGEGTAFLGSLARLHVIYSGETSGAPTSLIAKLPTTEPDAYQVGSFLRVWFREAMFYAHLASQLPVGVSVPTCRFNYVDERTGHTVLLLDDMAPAKAGDQLVGASVGQARAAVVALAQFQSTWWGKPRTEALDWVPGIDNPTSPAGLQGAMRGSIDAFDARYSNVLPAESIALNRTFINVVDRWLVGVAQRPLTIAHADYRLENLLFDPDDAVTIVDWQTAMYTGGVTDLAFLLATSVDTEVRRNVEQELINTYVEELAAHGVEPDLLRHVDTDYRGSMLWWMAMLGNNLANVEPTDARGAALFNTMLTRLHTAALDLDSASILDDLRG
jgi:hypothetical protein